MPHKFRSKWEKAFN